MFSMRFDEAMDLHKREIISLRARVLALEERFTEMQAGLHGVVPPRAGLLMPAIIARDGPTTTRVFDISKACTLTVTIGEGGGNGGICGDGGEVEKP